MARVLGSNPSVPTTSPHVPASRQRLTGKGDVRRVKYL
jgi:hypothetical protein